MLGLVVVVVLGSAVLLGTTLAPRLRLAPPVLLILLGGLLGLAPGLTDLELDSELVLLIFLPVILYWESLNTSLREIRANLRVIVLSSVVLVIVTMVAVSFAAQALGMDPAAAWVLGAVLAPTDAAAMAGLATQMPRRTVTVLRTESLINDGTALVLFAVALDVALGDERPGPAALAGQFLGSYAGGVVSGLVVSALVVLVRRRLDDPLREGALSVLTPFVAFLLAEEVHSSGVVAVVVSGLVLSYAGPRVIRARSRVQAFAFWDLSTFLLNGALFVLIGLQVPRVVRELRSEDLSRALVVAVLISLVVMITRLLWVHLSAYGIRAVDRRQVQRDRRIDWRGRTANGWCGFRGGVSLAAALAVPATVSDGGDFPDRDLLVFTTAVVILLTMLLQGGTLPAVVRWARLPADTGRDDEVQLARVKAAKAGVAALPELAGDFELSEEQVQRLQEDYEEHARITEEDSEETAAVRDAESKLRLAVLARKRLAVTELRDSNHIDDFVLRELQAEMDLEEVRLLGPEPRE